jgi:hypothetical protein
MVPDFVKYKKLTALAGSEDLVRFDGNNFEVYEKIDGGNCQVRKVDDWRLLGGSRANFLTGKHVINRVPWFGKFLKWMYSNPTLCNLPSDKIVFGEWLGNHTIRYLLENTDKFFVIDVLDINSGKFMPYANARKFVEDLGIKDVQFLRLLTRGELRRAKIENLLLNQESDYYPGIREGLVIKDYYSDEQLIMKLHHPMFAELKRLSDGTLDYLTPGRFRKNYFRLRDEIDGPIQIEKLAGAIVLDIEREGGPKLGLDQVIDRYDFYVGHGDLNLGKR